MKTKFGWWNTSLSPKGKSSQDDVSNEVMRHQASEVLSHLFSSYDLDAVGVCEVSADDLSTIAQALGPDFAAIPFNDAWGGRKIGDLGLIVRRDTTEVIAFEYESYYIEKRIFALGVSIAIKVNGFDFSFVISHWPSRLRMPRNAPDRNIYGSELRRVLQRLRQNDDTAHVILAGDYNDEPFDDSLSSHLMATRDTSRLRNTEFVSYNPFWRRLGTHEAFLKAPPGRQVAGSYRYASGKESTWYTFDQMIFSRDFVVGESWTLNELETGVVADSIIFDLVRKTTNRFDHLPIVGVVEENKS